MEEIYAQGGELDIVITLRDEIDASKSGRVFVDEFCAEHSVPLLKIKNVNDTDVIDAVHRHALDWLFIIGWSQIAKAPVLSAPRRGVLGMHPTLLPEGRGRAAIPWAIIKGLSKTGVTMFQLDEGVDTGPIVAQYELPLEPDETAATLYPRVQVAHRALIAQIWPALANDKVTVTPQDHSRASEWPGRRPSDGLITPSMTVDEADRLVRATTRPYPGAFWIDGDRTLRVWAGGRELRPGAVPLELADGTYNALDYEWEPV
jgi:methionyl-tRNA formyltransferase